MIWGSLISERGCRVADLDAYYYTTLVHAPVRQQWAWALALLATVGLGCRAQPSDSTSPVTDASISLDGGESDAAQGCAAPAAPSDIDFLFVLGASIESKDVQQRVLGAIDDLVPGLACALGARPNIQIGFVNADLGVGPFSIPRCTASGSQGLLETTAKSLGCQTPSGSFLIDVAGDGERITNFDGQLADVARCIGTVGSDSCAFEQPLAAAVLATDSATNPGLIRQGALLVIAMASGNDDCSAVNPALFDPDDVASFGPLSPFRCFREGALCDPDTPTTEGSKSDCGPREASAIMSSVEDTVSTLRSRKTNPNDVIIATFGGDPENVNVTVESGQARLGSSCDSTQTEIRAGAPIRLAASGTHVSVCPSEDSPESLFGPLIEALATAANR